MEPYFLTFNDADPEPITVEGERSFLTFARSADTRRMNVGGEVILLSFAPTNTHATRVEGDVQVLTFRPPQQRTVVSGDPRHDLMVVTPGGVPGVPGPPGPPGPVGTEPDLPDLTLLFENGLI